MSNYTWGLLVFGGNFAVNVLVIIVGTVKSRTPPNRRRTDVLPPPSPACERYSRLAER